MSTVVVSSKYQVVIPKEIRERHGYKPGDRLAWFDGPFGSKLIKPLSLKEMSGILADGREREPFVREKDFDGGEFT